MPILKVDQNGQIYASDPDREDGQGYGYAPECVEQQDLTLGSAYLKSQGVRQAELVKLRRDQRILDHEAEAKKMQTLMMNDRAKKRDMAQVRIMENPVAKNAVMKKALSMGCNCEYKTPMSGNVLSANGQFGIRGMTPDQQTIHSVAMGRDSGVHRVDQGEAQQHQMRIQAERIMRIKARR